MKNLKAHLAILGANIIYGINYSVAKGLMPNLIAPSPFVLMRVAGATLLFYFVSRSKQNVVIEKQDKLKLFWCAIFGVVVNQMLFFHGLSRTSGINAAILMVATPILVLILSSTINREKITFNKIAGIVLGMTGALWLITNKGNAQFGASIVGDLMIFFNAISYAIYLSLAKPLMNKYHPLVIIYFTFLYAFPFILLSGIWEINTINWIAFTQFDYLSLAYVIVFTTFFAYLLNTYGIAKVSPNLVSVYIYSQPLLAAIVGVIIGKETLVINQLYAGILIFLGVYLVSFQKKTPT